MTTFTDGFGGDVFTAIDTYTQQGDPDSVFGAVEYFQLLVSDCRNFLQFNLASIPDDATIRQFHDTL